MTLPLLLAGALAVPFQEPEEGAAPAPAEDAGDDAAEAVEKVYPLSVEDVVRLAREHAPTLHQARLAAMAAEGGVMEADGVYDPVLFSDATYSYVEQPASGFFSNFGNVETRSVSAAQGLRQALTTGGSLSVALNETYRDQNFLERPQSDVDVTFSYNQPLLRGGWRLTATQALRQADYQHDRSLAGVRQAGLDAVQAAVDAYWDLAFALADVEVKEKSLELARQLREMTMVKFDAGAVAEVEVVQTEADIASRSDDLLTARNAVEQAEDRLRLLLFGLEAEREWDWRLRPDSDPPGAESMELAWSDAMAAAREYRADLRQARIDVERAELDWRVARRQRLPQLDFNATANFFEQDEQVGPALQDLSDREFPGYTFGLMFELPLGNHQFEGAERRARFEFQLAVRELRDRENEVANEVRDAVRSVNFLAERVEVTARARRVAARQLEAEQRRLREGASTNFQVLQFQTDLALAESQEAQARMEYAKARVRLHTVQGLNWDGTRPDLARLDDYAPAGR